MNTLDRVTGNQEELVAFIVTHSVKPGQEKRYEGWLTQILDAVGNFPGYVGREIFRPGQGAHKYTTIVRFDSQDHLNAWAESDTRKSYISRVIDLLEKGDLYEIRSGIDFWFTPEGVRPPKPWKQFLLTVTAVYPLSLIIPSLLGPVFVVAPFLTNPLIKGLLIAVILTGLLTFVIMPRFTRLVKRWLYDQTV